MNEIHDFSENFVACAWRRHAALGMGGALGIGLLLIRSRAASMKFSDLKHSGHWPTLVSSFLYFDYSFMVWTLLGVLANQIAAPESLNLTAQQRFFMVSVPILFGGLFRLVLGLLVDRI